MQHLISLKYTLKYIYNLHKLWTNIISGGISPFFYLYIKFHTRLDSGNKKDITML